MGDIIGIRRFWVRKTEPWAATRRDSKREASRDKNCTMSNRLMQVGEHRLYLVNTEMFRSHACAWQCLCDQGSWLLMWDVMRAY